MVFVKGLFIVFKRFCLSCRWVLFRSIFIDVFGLETAKYLTRKLIDRKIQQGHNYIDKENEV